MQQRLINFMSISLLVITAAQAAASSGNALIELLPQFKTEADFPNKTKLKYIGGGFLIGTMQQMATFGLILRNVTVREAVVGLYAQWALFVGSSICVRNEFAENIRDLTAHNTECARMLFNKLAPLDINSSPQEIQTKNDRLQKFINEYKAGRNHTADVRNTFNDLLASNIKLRSLCEGYMAASILGPVSSLGAAWMLTLIKRQYYV